MKSFGFCLLCLQTVEKHCLRILNLPYGRIIYIKLHISNRPLHTMVQNYLKCTCSHWEFCIFVMFSTFHDEMQYIFLEKNFIFMVFLAVKVAGTDVI